MNITFPLVELGNICAIKGGKRLPEGMELIKSVTQHPYIRARDISNGKINFTDPVYITDDTFKIIKQYIVSEGDVIITIVGANIGDTAFVDQEFDGANLTENAVKLSAGNDLHAKFLKYALISSNMKDYFQMISSGAAQGKLGIYKIKKVQIPLPHLSIQKKIAAILSAYDDLIENNLKQIRLLEEMAQITYQEWFVRLKFPNHENTPIDETTGLPIGWHFGKVIDLIELQRGFDLPIQDREHGSIPIIASTGTVGFHSSYKVQGAGVVTGRSGTIGQVMFVDSDFFPLNTTLWVKSYKSCKPIFVKHLLDSLNLESLCGGAAVPSLDRKAVHVQKAVIPPAKLMNDFDVYAASHYEAMKVLRSQNQLLKEARDILLPRLMTGKITAE